MSSTGWLILALLNIPVYIGLGRLFFRTWKGFWECIRFWFTPDILSGLRGEYLRDSWGEFKLALWLASCAACVWAEATLIARLVD